MKRYHVVIRGRVQGVGFRAWAAREGAALELSGWIKNLSDGTVECVFEGDAGRGEEFLKKLWKGPSLAKVYAVESNTSAYVGDLKGFSVTH